MLAPSTRDPTDPSVHADPRGGRSPRVADAGGRTRSPPSCSQLTGPGVPDLYQGTELWDDSLVDPDNRRPVDYDARRRCSPRSRGERPGARRSRRSDDGPKLLVPVAALLARRQHPEPFDRPTSRSPRPGHGRRPWSPSTAAGPSPSATRLRRPRRPAAAGARRSSRCRRGLARRALGPRVTATCRSPRCSPPRPSRCCRAPRRSTPSADASTSGRRRRSALTLQVGDRADADGPAGRRLVDAHRAGARGEVDYGYLVDDADPPLPDPRSRRQPHGVHGPSRSFDAAAHGGPTAAGPAAAGRLGRSTSCTSARSPPRARSTRPSGGSTTSSTRRRPRRADAGQRVLRPPRLGLRRRACGRRCTRPTAAPTASSASSTPATRRGLGVILDVVYNHLGPAGNYLPALRPVLHRPPHTPGATPVNLDGPGSDEVRRTSSTTCRMWLRDYHVDGLRLDAVHALFDDSRGPPPRGAGRRGGRACRRTCGRPLVLIAETDLNDPRLVTPARGGRLRARRAVERRLPPRAARRADRRDRRLLRRLRPPGDPRQGPRPRGLLPRRHATQPFRGRPHGRPPTASGCPAAARRVRPRTTTRSATGPAASGCRRVVWTTTSWPRGRAAD